MDTCFGKKQDRPREKKTPKKSLKQIFYVKKSKKKKANMCKHKQPRAY